MGTTAAKVLQQAHQTRNKPGTPHKTPACHPLQMSDQAAFASASKAREAVVAAAAASKEAASTAAAADALAAGAVATAAAAEVAATVRTAAASKARAEAVALAAALVVATAKADALERAIPREARDRRDRLLEAQQEAVREAEKEAAEEGAGDHDPAPPHGGGLVSSVPGMQRKVILSGGRLQGCGGTPMDRDQRPESVPAGARKRVPPLPYSPSLGLALTLALTPALALVLAL